MTSQALTRDDLYSLEKYAELRGSFRAKVLEHKRHRQLQLGPFATLYFEDRLTMQYQIQEMLRIERIFEAQGIQEELDAYNPLIPDGHNWKATFMIEVPDPEQRRQVLARLVGIEDRVWVRIGSSQAVYAIADEDMERETSDKTSAVHFLRFELDPEMIAAAKQGAAIAIGIDHAQYQHEMAAIPDPLRRSLLADLA